MVNMRVRRKCRKAWVTKTRAFPGRALMPRAWPDNAGRNWCGQSLLRRGTITRPFPSSLSALEPFAPDT
jgi:hypothetical protein